MSSSFFYCIECVKRTCARKSELSVVLVGGGGWFQPHRHYPNRCRVIFCFDGNNAGLSHFVEAACLKDPKAAKRKADRDLVQSPGSTAAFACRRLWQLALQIGSGISATS